MRNKLATAIGSAPPDPVKSQAATSPMPVPVVENKTAPGQTGPRGLSPRTTYSRVNASPPPVSTLPDQVKVSPPRGAEFLPKVAHKEQIMNMATRPTLHEMLTAAMEGTIERVNITKEAARQLGNHSDEAVEKTASEEVDTSHYPTEHLFKMAAALEYISDTVKQADEGHVQQPGEGPGALTVLEAQGGSPVLEAGQSGKAVSSLQADKPETQTEKVQSGKANTGMATNDETMHGEQPEHPIKNASASLLDQNLERLGIKQAAYTPEKRERDQALVKKLKPEHTFKKNVEGITHGATAGAMVGAPVGFLHGAFKAAPNMANAIAKEHGKAGKAVAGAKELGKGIAKGYYKGVGHGAVGGMTAMELARGVGAKRLENAENRLEKHKKASAPLALIRKLAGEDVSPAHISAGAAVPPDASEAGQGVPSEPGDVNSQKAMISSNEAAINYTKGQAKADPKKDVNQVLTQPALTREGDNVLFQAFDHASQAGTKFGSARNSLAGDTIKVAAARALLSNLMDKAATEKGGKKKEKDSMMGSAPTSPTAASGFTANTLG